MYKGNIALKSSFSILIGSVISARAGIEKKLILEIGDGKAPVGFQRVREADPKSYELLVLLRDARHIAAHDEIDNYQAEFRALLEACEKFVHEVNGTWPNGWKNCLSEKGFFFASRDYSAFERAVEILFHEVAKKFDIKLESIAALDGFYPPGVPSLTQRVEQLVLTRDPHDFL
ncbi:hypothetical protein PQQ86_15750 [Paraburkholderia sediminicola]|uniref:hypothetical protein n=1 Tax=Paraburkholderia sediminicola TaxID=458836 RepID=UPI0038B7B94F